MLSDEFMLSLCIFHWLDCAREALRFAGILSAGFAMPNAEQGVSSVFLEVTGELLFAQSFLSYVCWISAYDVGFIWWSKASNPWSWPHSYYISSKTMCRIALSSLICRRRQKLAHCGVTDVDAVKDTLERIDSSRITIQEFAERYELPKVPVVITGFCKDWPAKKAWTEADLLQKYANHRFKVSSVQDLSPKFYLA